MHSFFLICFCLLVEWHILEMILKDQNLEEGSEITFCTEEK